MKINLITKKTPDKIIKYPFYFNKDIDKYLKKNNFI